MIQKNKIIKTYQNFDIAKNFDSERFGYSFQRYKHKIEDNFLRSSIKKYGGNKKLKILDVACGTGRMLKAIKESCPSAEYFGLDASKAMTKILKKRSKELNLKVNLKLGDATKMPFKDDTFDITYTYHLTWHLPQKLQRKIIKEMLRVTKKEGYILFDVLNENFLWEKIKKIFGKKPTEGIYKMNISKLKKSFKSKKYRIEKLSDFPIKNSALYSIANLINMLRKILPLSLFHMIYFRVKK